MVSRRQLLTATLTLAALSHPQLVRAADLSEIRSRVKPGLKRRVENRGFGWSAELFIRILKEERDLEVWLRRGERFALFQTYPICTWSGELGPKLRQGDQQAPEGFYFTPPRAMNSASQYHLSYNLGYPNAYDRTHGRTGNNLMVHGRCVSIGCYAMTDAGIEEIYLLAEAGFDNGQPFFRTHIFPFRMTDENMQRHASARWTPFWENLREGYDLFERDALPPDVSVAQRRYFFAQTNPE